MFPIATTSRISIFTTLCLSSLATCDAADPYAPRVEFGARLEPGNRIIHGAGQDAKGFSGYAKCFDGNHQPLIYMTYISLRKPEAEIMAWGTRLERELAELSPAKPIPQIGLNLTGGKDNGSNLDVEISEGKFDAHIVAFADALASLGRPVFIRIGYEFDGKWNNYQPATFQASWKRITRVLRERNLPFATVWCATGGSSGWPAMQKLMEFYPGDEFVDWWGVDVFSAKELTHPQLEVFLDASSRHRKPVMIGEMTPRHVGVLEGQKSWDEWFGPMIELLKRRPEIKATAYINWEWREQSDRLGFKWHNWGDARIEGNALVRDRWVKELSDPIYLHAPRDGSCPLPPITITPSATSSLKTAFTEPPTEGGWIPLFNGRDLSGWSVQCQPKDHGKIFWQADAGTILCDSMGRADHDYVWLVSEKEYGNFELRLKFQAYTRSTGNSGIQFRSRYVADDKDGWLNGPQVDIHPPAEQSWRTGLIYDETRGEQRWVSPSLPDWKINAESKPAGHVLKYADGGDIWNDLIVIARGTHVKTIVNGVVCTDWEGSGTLDNAAHRAKNVGLVGHFALQLHVKDQLLVRFKDLFVRELDH
jgi:hypothetical protein